jgi:hypothetical protein
MTQHLLLVWPTGRGLDLELYSEGRTYCSQDKAVIMLSAKKRKLVFQQNGVGHVYRTREFAEISRFNVFTE